MTMNCATLHGPLKQNEGNVAPVSTDKSNCRIRVYSMEIHCIWDFKYGCGRAGVQFCVSPVFLTFFKVPTEELFAVLSYGSCMMFTAKLHDRSFRQQGIPT